MSWFSHTAPLLPEIIDGHGRWRGQQVALIDDASRRTWGQLVRDVAGVDHQLREHGIRPGQRVAVLADNAADVLIAYLGIIRAGAVVVPLNTYVSDAGLIAMLRDCEARALIADPAHAPRMDAAANWPDTLNKRLMLGPSQDNWIALRTRGASQPDCPPAALADDAECNIIYSSGTTGVPKGIVHTHRPRLDWAYDLGLALRYHSGAVTLLSLGLFSNISWAAMLSTLLMGGTLVVMPRFEAHAFAATVARHGATHSAMVPVQFQQLMELPRAEIEGLASLRQLMCCGSPLHLDLKRRVMQALPAQLTELYGLTEGVITTLDPEVALERLSSVGKPLQGTDIKIIGDHDLELPIGESGEIVGRGRILMAGYNNRPDANREATWTDDQGRPWLRTGDIGRLDEAGYLYLVDRKKDMIISGGQNLYPADIEAVAASHPGVAEVAVIGVPSARWGETPLALVVPGQRVDEQELTTWLNDRLGKQQRVKRVILVESLPRNPNGKILKRELRERFARFGDSASKAQYKESD